MALRRRRPHRRTPTPPRFRPIELPIDRHPVQVLVRMFLVIVLSVVGCTHQDTGGSTPTTRTPSIAAADPTTPTDNAEDSLPTTRETISTTPTTGPQTDEEAILATVEGYWETLYRGSAPPDPQYPGLEQYLDGEQLERSRSLVQERFNLGQALRMADDPQYSNEASAVEVDGSSAVVDGCGIDDLVLYQRNQDVVLNDSVSTSRWRLTLQKSDSGWKVVRSEVLQSWEGVAGCALSS